MNKRKKILILGSKEFPMGTNKKEDLISSGGIEVYVQSFADNFKNDDSFDITILTRRFSGVGHREKYASNITVHYIPWVNAPILRNLVFNFLSFVKGLRIDFDAIFCFGVVSTFFSRFLGFIKRVPVVCAPCGIAYTQPQYNVIIKMGLYVLEKLTYRGINALVFLSESEKENFNKTIYNSKRSYAVPVGIPEDIDKKEPALDIMKMKGSKKAVVFLGRLNEVKRVDTIIDAVQMLDRDDFVFFVVGSGPLEEKLKERAYGAQNIYFMGFRKDVINILKATDIFVLASESEGSAIALVEAYSCGCACVVSDIGLYTKDGSDALLFTVGDSLGLKENIEMLLDDKKLRNKLSKNAKKRVRSEFNWDAAKKKYKELFLSL